jgi:hypothetical protein
MGATLTLVARTDHDYALNAARAELGADALAAAWERGRAMPLEEAISAILDDEERTPYPLAACRPEAAVLLV